MKPKQPTNHLSNNVKWSIKQHMELIKELESSVKNNSSSRMSSPSRKWFMLSWANQQNSSIQNFYLTKTT